MKYLLGAIVLFVAATVVAGIGLWSGSYNVAADDPHTPLVHRVLEIGRERSIAKRVPALEVPDLADPERRVQGAGNYAAMCETCHLRPGIGDTELRRGMYPQPPVLALRSAPDPARDYWIIKHGLKASGMPAWGLSMEDDTIWGMVAFLRWLPGRSPEEYQAAVSASSGHSHGDADAEMPSEPDSHDTVPHEHGEHEE